jgi:hypothetical protein
VTEMARNNESNNIERQMQTNVLKKEKNVGLE